MAVVRWINREKRRYYTAALVEDLFQASCLITAWGGTGSRRGGTRSQAFLCEQDAQRALEALRRRRRRRGYVITPLPEGRRLLVQALPLHQACFAHEGSIRAPGNSI
ncbi:MAG: WGR domain-containing protein [Anaerolineae bacterium]|nr:WGR domain-containing protein [Anaerolineae bacterium]MCZ2115600.1 WGR domain-containing protein [Anaerolineae bacterium]